MSGHAAYSAVELQGENDLVVRYAPLVKRIAQHLMHRLPSSVQIDDLIQSGMIGLLEAARQYDPSQGASFQTYAGIRIRGAMLDEMRKLDWTPRSVHRKSREVAEAIHILEHRVGRDPKDQEIAEFMGIGLDELHNILQDASSAKLFSIDQDAEENGETHTIRGDTPEPLAMLQDGGFKNALAEAIGQLPEREQLVMSLYYDEELNLKEIGAVLGVSESRVSQIHGRIMIKLRAFLAEWVNE